MQVTLDIPDQTYQELEAIAATEQVPVATIINDRLQQATGAPLSSAELARLFPLIPSRRPNSITSEQIAEFDPFDPS